MYNASSLLPPTDMDPLMLTNNILQVKDQSFSNGTSQPLAEAEAAPEARSAVAWVTGHDAVAMEKASDEEFQGKIISLMKKFPALDLPQSFKVLKSLVAPTYPLL